MKSALLVVSMVVFSASAFAQWSTFGSTVYYNSGGVGVGTVSPSARFHVFDGDIMISPSTGNGTNRSLIFDASTSVNFASLISMRRSGTLRWNFGATGGSGVDNFEFFRYSDAGAFLGSALKIERASGAIGIGTGSTSLGTMKLAVEGKIGAREVVVTLVSPWPDFVFEPTHNLPSLSEIKSYVSVNKHLPGIPSQAEVEKDGHELGKMDRLLLQKVEEMTLYLIQLKEENDKLKERIEALESNSNN